MLMCQKFILRVLLLIASFAFFVPTVSVLAEPYYEMKASYLSSPTPICADHFSHELHASNTLGYDHFKNHCAEHACELLPAFLPGASIIGLPFHSIKFDIFAGALVQSRLLEGLLRPPRLIG
jgi:hypothetical protein